MDLANLSNEQATRTFKTQQKIQSLFTDQAQENAARQFNATSQNQTDQFFANLSQRTKEFNEIIKKREDMIAELQQRLAGAEKPAPKKKATRKKKSVTK